MITASYGMSQHALSQLQGVQALTIRLFFDDELRERYRANAAAVLDEHQLQARCSSLIPDIGSAAFDAESFGRRFLIAQEVTLRYRATLGALCGSADPREVVTSAPFRRFLASAHFLTNRHGLPHPNGVGTGYEAVTKFFYWLRDTYELRVDTVQHELRSLAFAEFGVHIVAFARVTGLPLYQAARRGAYFALSSQSDRLVVIWRNATVKIVDMGSSEHPGQAGLQDLDELRPG